MAVAAFVVRIVVAGPISWVRWAADRCWHPWRSACTSSAACSVATSGSGRPTMRCAPRHSNPGRLARMCPRVSASCEPHAALLPRSPAMIALLVAALATVLVLRQVTLRPRAGDPVGDDALRRRSAEAVTAAEGGGRRDRHSAGRLLNDRSGVSERSRCRTCVVARRRLAAADTRAWRGGPRPLVPHDSGGPPPPERRHDCAGADRRTGRALMAARLVVPMDDPTPP